MRRIVLNLHLCIALIAGAFMVILGLTGSIMEFAPELDRSLHPHLSYVTPGRSVLSLAELGDAVSRKSNGEPIVAYLPAQSSGLSSQILLPSGVAYANPYTGEILGMRTRGPGFLGYVRAIHVRLAAGDVGRAIMRWSGVAMIFSLLSGVYLWWPLKRIRIIGGRRSRLWFDLHNSVGIFLLLPFAMLAVTGTVLGFEDQLAPLTYKLTGSLPAPAIRFAVRKPEPGAKPITPDEAVAIARTRLPGAVPYRVQMPNYGGLYRVSLFNPRDKITGMRNTVVLDPCAGDVVSVSQASDLSSGDRLLAMNEAFHTGAIFGMPSRITVCVTSSILLLQILSGLLMWLRRKKIRPTSKRLSNAENNA